MVISIDGSYKEGGGQILRTSLSLSSIIKTPVKVYNIRKNRKPPGLKIQHYHSVNLLRKITRASVNGLEIGSETIEFRPKNIYGGKYKEDIPTAGSISLVLQLILPVIVFANRESKIIISGGTDVKHSPSMDYMKRIIIPYYSKFGKIELNVLKRGFYPKGGGLVELKVKPKFHRGDYKNFWDFVNDLKNNIEPLVLDPNEDIKSIEIYTTATKDLKNRNVAERINKSFIQNIEADVKIKKYREYVDSLSTGVVSTVVIKRETYVSGFDILGEKRLSSEQIGKILANRVNEFLKNNVSVDDNLSDNLVTILSLIDGEFYSKNLTGHLETNIWVVNNFIRNRVKYTMENGKIKVYT